MPNLNELTNEELIVLYDEIQMIRNLIIKKIQEYGYTANDIMTKNMEHVIEGIIGRRHLQNEN